MHHVHYFMIIFKGSLKRVLLVDIFAIKDTGMLQKRSQTFLRVGEGEGSFSTRTKSLWCSKWTLYLRVPPISLHRLKELKT